jgi:hypothetical protein
MKLKKKKRTTVMDDILAEQTNKHTRRNHQQSCCFLTSVAFVIIEWAHYNFISQHRHEKEAPAEQRPFQKVPLKSGSLFYLFTRKEKNTTTTFDGFWCVFVCSRCLTLHQKTTFCFRRIKKTSACPLRDPFGAIKIRGRSCSA